MPFSEQSPLATAVGMAGGWFAGQQKEKELALQREQQQQASAIAMAQMQMDRQRLKDSEDAAAWNKNEQVIRDRVDQGLDPQTGKPFKPSIPPPKNGTPAQMADWARNVARLALAAGNMGIAEKYLELASNADLGDYRSAQAQYTTQGRLPLAQAQTKNVEGLFDQQVRLMGMRLNGAERVAGIRAARAGVRARGNPADSAYMSMLRSISSESVRAAVQASVDQYVQGSENWRATYDPNNPQASGPPPQYQPPNLSITVAPSASGPIPILLPAGVTIPDPRKATSQSRSSGYPPGTRATIKGKPVVMGSDGQWHAATPSMWQGFGSP